MIGIINGSFGLIRRYLLLSFGMLGFLLLSACANMQLPFLEDKANRDKLTIKPSVNVPLKPNIAPKQNEILKAEVPNETEIALLPYEFPALEKLKTYREQLMHLDGSNLTSLFGAPNFIRKEGNVEVWYYAQNECIGEFYIYAKDKGGEVRWMEFLNAQDFSPFPESCLEANQIIP